MAQCEEQDLAAEPERAGESAQRRGFQAEGQAGIGGGLSAAVLRSAAGWWRASGAEAEAAAIRTRGAT